MTEQTMTTITVDGAAVALIDTGYDSKGGKRLHKAELVLEDGSKCIIQLYASGASVPVTVASALEAARATNAKLKTEAGKRKIVEAGASVKSADGGAQGMPPAVVQGPALLTERFDSSKRKVAKSE